VTAEVICLAIVLGASSGAPKRRVTAPTELAAIDVTARLRELLADPRPAAAAALRERVGQGAPPVALLALLDAYRAKPRPELLDVVQGLASYRRTDVRAHALTAWAQTGPHEADLAIAAAADDLDPGIRRLAVSLAERHPSPAASSRIDDLLAHDHALAEEIAARAAARLADDDEPVIEVEP
jgi:hypothetical protein